MTLDRYRRMALPIRLRRVGRRVLLILFIGAGFEVRSNPIENFVASHCLDCHDGESEKGGINLEAALEQDIGSRLDVWERVLRQLSARQMPPPGRKRPVEAGYATAVARLEPALDRAWAAKPDPGRTETLRRLTRAEYQNVIRDLLALEIDAARWLHADEAGHGFDNVTVGELSPQMLDRYITAARKISRLAVGRARATPDVRIVRVRPDRTQEARVEGLPPGTRGGLLLRHTFPRDGRYDIRINLARDRNEHVEGMRGVHQMDLLLDRRRVKTFTVKPPPNRNDHTEVDRHLQVRLPIKAGPRDLGITFVQKNSSLEETMRQPYQAHF
ncbi:MAG: DUF1587 domain-containing protein, partial [Verrucomicrobiota bacterium]